jgi:hypothetical protein
MVVGPFGPNNLNQKGRATPNPSPKSAVPKGLSQAKWPVHIAQKAACAYAPDMDVSVEINCELCGSANYSLPDGEADSGTLVCNDCGADQGTLGELKAALAALVLDHSAEAQRRRLETLRGTASGT